MKFLTVTGPEYVLYIVTHNKIVLLSDQWIFLHLRRLQARLPKQHVKRFL